MNCSIHIRRSNDMQAPVTQLYENTWAIEDRGVRIFVLERVFPEKAVVRQMRRKNPLIKNVRSGNGGTIIYEDQPYS